MKGLVLKDWYSVVNNGRGLFIMMAVLSLALTQQGGLVAFILTGTVICSMMISTSFSIDYHTKWNRFAFTLPVSKEKIVQSKFLSLIGFILLGIVLSYLFGSASLYITKKQNIIFETTIAEYVSFTVLAFSIALFFGTNMIVLFLKYGAEQARLYLIVSYVIPAALLFFLVTQVPVVNQWINQLSIMTLSLLICVFSITWTFLGYLVARNIIKKKEY